MTTSRHLLRAAMLSALLLISACGANMSPAPPAPAPIPTGQVTANVYVLPGAIDLGQNAFGDEPVVIYKGERMRWRNLDGTTHNVVADSPVLPEFMTTGMLAPGEDRSFDMATLGTTKVHCTIHPQMVGTLVVRERWRNGRSLLPARPARPVPSSNIDAGSRPATRPGRRSVVPRG